MNHQTETTVRELSLEDLDRVSGAGLGIAQLQCRKAGGAAVQFEPNGPTRDIIVVC